MINTLEKCTNVSVHFAKRINHKSLINFQVSSELLFKTSNKTLQSNVYQTGRYKTPSPQRLKGDRMKSIGIGTCIALLIVGALWAQNITKPEKSSTEAASVALAIDKGAKWLASVQGADGGWGQDGGETSYIRTTERLESNGNDVANTAVSALALLEAGKQYQPNVDRALDFILRRVEASPADGLAITDARGTQIQRKLGPYIDTFLTSMLLAKVDGTLSKATQNARVRQALEKCVAKIERNQKADGSWNIAGGWAPVLGTSMASRSLFEAQ